MGFTCVEMLSCFKSLGRLLKSNSVESMYKRVKLSSFNVMGKAEGQMAS